MNNKTGWLLYESESASVNKWFIEKLQKECEPYGLTLKLVYTDYISDAYAMNLSSLADELLSSKGVPDFIVNRSRNADIAYDFEKQGIRVFNPAKVTEVANDKELSYNLADKLGIPYMPFVTVNEEEIISMLPDPGYGNDDLTILYAGIRSLTDTEGYNSVRLKAEAFGYPFVLKPAEGHGGKHVSLINSESELLTAIKGILVDHNRYPYRKLIMQRLASVRGRDLRIYFIGGRIVAGMMRTAKNSGDLCANFSLGGNASLHTPHQRERSLAEKLADALPGDYMGVDFVFDKDGEPVFNEFEDVVGARMVYANTDIDMISLFAHHIGSVVSG
ncbi:MAG: hypothetical protein K6G27_06450 [Lachnospiraceae bacterium]|nr:hypothetical protein [Lachnospiraceae bacterium]